MMSLLNFKHKTKSIGIASALLLGSFQVQATEEEGLVQLWSSFANNC